MTEPIKLKLPKTRRYLVPIHAGSVPQMFTDCLVIGSGIAGLRAAISAGAGCEVVLACKDKLTESNTWNAQGGIASVLDSQSDSYGDHIADTITTGCGINDERIVEEVVKAGPELVRQLDEWGTDFDRQKGKIDITREGGHTNPRIAHAQGDSTGRAIAQALIKKIKADENITIIEDFFAIDILTDDENNCLGLIGHSRNGTKQVIRAKTTILATGGAGRLYRETTNPPIATADGLAMAARAGAVLRDIEFMQFHPTTLYIAGASRALITETLRGEGAVLLDAEHNAFMKDYHPDAELAPRDVVSRAILSQMLNTGSTHVYLDVRHFDREHFKKRFPLISELVESFDIDISKELIPVRPSAHYMVGGVKTDASGKTSINNLYACGEVASTGLHGANRLGSNSLLEALVFGKVAGNCAVEAAGASPSPIPMYKLKYDVPRSDRTRLDTADVFNSLRSLMWRNVGITRFQRPLAEAAEIIQFWQRYVLDKVFDEPEGWQCQNMLIVSNIMAAAAAERTESRGVHYRGDYPDTDDKNFKTHIEFE